MDHKTKLSEQSKHVVEFNMYKTSIKQIELGFLDSQVRRKDTSVHSNDLEELSKGIIGKCKGKHHILHPQNRKFI